MKHLKIIYFSNSWEYLLASCIVIAVLFLVLLFIKRILTAQLYKRARLTTTCWDDILAETISSTCTLSLFVFSLLSGIYILDLPDEVNNVNGHLAAVVFLFQCGLWFSKAMSCWLSVKASSRRADGTRHETINMHIIGFIIRIVIWSIVLLLILDNLGINITALIASLGIGGIAVALAVQNILGDLFASLSIAIDKPFEVGDSIVIDDLNGTVKYVGLKTTRLTSISGEELVISNADLLKSRIHNFKKMQERRMVFTIGVTFDTSSEKLRRISGIIRDIFSHIPTVRLDRVHFSSIGQSSLDFEIAYYVKDSSYTVAMDAQQEINLSLIEHFAKENIEFAFPTQTLYVTENVPGSAGT
ncbi:mechanosensitive ion channel family protein [Oxalobacter aliiformigenes]|uniref:mechanosensitive ion channel family protein n=1 Tax=Oxalobacter aliiformigenes TaxID=2946593 RepID=UPI0022AFD5AA|nr:mechanosensitive ion channel family protein [Oxalobacter aliiformigenes]MCZ4064642.1 mechanosensitive ion channel family protein [Oxalobacter aliiformigenes]WAV99112.1 mechanosensitive ion channel family protein [Oxalobacter aliiformigenes]